MDAVARIKVFRLPEELVQRMHLQPGDEVLVMEADEGVYLSPPGSAFHRAYDALQETGRAYQEMLGEALRAEERLDAAGYR